MALNPFDEESSTKGKNISVINLRRNKNRYYVQLYTILGQLLVILIRNISFLSVRNKIMNAYNYRQKQLSLLWPLQMSRLGRLIGLIPLIGLIMD